MSYGSPSRCIAEEQQILRAVRAGAVPGRRLGQRVRGGQPARVPRQPAARADGRRDRARRPARRSSPTRARRSTSRAPGIGILTARPGRRSTPTAHGDGFAPVERHVVLGADGRGRRRLGPRRAARADAVPGGAGRAPRRARRRRARLRERDRLRRAQPARRARAAGRRPTTRSSPTTTSATSTAARSASSRPRSTTAAASDDRGDGRRRRGPDRRLPRQGPRRASACG